MLTSIVMIICFTHSLTPLHHIISYHIPHTHTHDGQCPSDRASGDGPRTAVDLPYLITNSDTTHTHVHVDVFTTRHNTHTHSLTHSLTHVHRRASEVAGPKARAQQHGVVGQEHCRELLLSATRPARTHIAKPSYITYITYSSAVVQ